MIKKEKISKAKSTDASKNLKKVEEALGDAENNFALAFKYGFSGMCISSIDDGRYIDVNDAYLNNLGYKREEIIGRTSSDINLWVDMADRDVLMKELIQNGKVTEFELRFRDKHGNIHWGLTSAVIIKIAGKPCLLTQTTSQTLNVSERKQAEETVRKSKENLNIVLAHAHMGYWELDISTQTFFWSDEMFRIFGFDPALGPPLINDFINQVYPDDRELLDLYITKNTEQRPRSIEHRFVRPDGNIIWVDCYSKHIFDDKGNIIKYFGASHDITERKQYEEKLRIYLNQLNNINENLADGMVYQINSGKDGKLRDFTYLSPAVERFHGVKLEDALRNPSLIYGQILEEDRDSITAAEAKAYIDKNKLDKEVRIRMPSGEIRWRQFVSAPNTLSNGDIVWDGIEIDITERKKAEEVLSKSERKYSATFHLIPNPMAVTEMATGKIIDVNQEFIRWTGYSREELIRVSTRDLNLWVNPEDRVKITSELTATGEVNGTEIMMRQKNGHIRNVLFSARFIEIDEKSYLLTLAQDITERKRAENLIKASEEQYRLLADHMKDQVWLMDLKMNITYASPSVERLTGYSSDEIKKLPMDKLLTPESFKKAIQFTSISMPRALKKSSKDLIFKTLELEFIIKGGQTIWGECSFSFIRDDKGKVVSILGEARNITERKLAEEKLQKTLESLKKAVGATIQVLVSALEARDPYTAGHQSRSASVACAIATEMGLCQDKIEGIRMAGTIHDIGKLSIPAEILTKPSRLSEIEFNLVKDHSRSGYEMLKEVESPWALAEIVYQHHERMNGTGYPRKLKGDEILLESRILAVADVVEAMASHRPYRAALGIDAALEEIEKNKGILYDAAVADACLKLFREKGYQLT